MFRKMPIILIAAILILFFIDPWLPLSLKKSLYALSLTIKSLIVFVLPFLIFMLLFKTIASYAKQATKLLIVLLVAICCSNYLSTVLSYFVGKTIYQFDFSLSMPIAQQGLLPSWVFEFPKILPNNYAMALGIGSGILCSLISPPFTKRVSFYFDRITQSLMKMLVVILPFFLMGFAVKFIHDKTLQQVAVNYSLVFLIVALSQFSYIAFLFLVSQRMKWRLALENIRNMVPSAIAGFSSMSSAAAMPLTIVGAERSTKNPPFARFTIPMTVNSHLIGDCFAIPIFAFAVMKHFGAPEASILGYLVFAFCFVLAKFSVAAIPGGGILVMLPILESYLGFTPEMSSLITALYILFDPIITCANVCGNGAFAVVLNRWFGHIRWQENTHAANPS